MSIGRRGAVAMGVTVAFFWGLSFLSIKTAVAVVPPNTLGLARFVIATALLFAYFAVRRKRPRLVRRDLPLMALSGFVGVTLYFLTENNGVLCLTASESSIIIGTIPVLTVLADRVFLGARLRPRQAAGAALSTLGVALIVVESLRLSVDPLGYAFMAGSAVSWVAYAFLTKPLLDRYDGLEVTFWQSLFGGIGFIPFALAEKTELSAVGPVVMLNVLYLGVFCSALGYLMYVHCLDVLGAGVSSVFINLIPVVSVAASFALLGERLTGVQLAGGAAAVIGVWLASAAGKRATGKSIRPESMPPGDFDHSSSETAKRD